MSDESVGERDLAPAMENASDAARAMTSQLLNIAEACLALGRKAGWQLTLYDRAQAEAECGDDLARARGELKRAKKDFDAAAAARDELARLLHEAEKREGASGSWDVAADSTTPRGMLLAALDRIAEVTGVMVRRVEVEWATDVVRGKKVPDFTLTRGY